MLRYMKNCIVILVFLFFVGLSGCSSPNSNSLGIVRFDEVAPNIMRGGLPSKKGFQILKEQYDVKTILSLCCNQKLNKKEKDLVENLGVEFISIPIDAQNKQGLDKIERCLNIISDTGRQPVFIHCLLGKDRTGLICAAYRTKVQKWNFSDSFKEMLSYGYDQARYYKLKESLIDWYEYLKQEAKGGFSE